MSATSHISNKVFLLRLVGSLVALVLLVILLRQQGWNEISEAIRQIPPWRFGLAMGLTGISRLAVAGRWHVLLRAVGVNISPGQTTRLTFAGLFASNFLPTTIGGDVIRLAGALQLKFDAATCTASLVVDRLVGMTGMAMALPFGIPEFLKTFWGGSTSALFPFSKWGKAIWEKGRGFLSSLIQALSRWIGQPRALFGALAFSWVHMLCLFASIALLLDGMGEEMSFWLIAGLWSVVYFVTLVPISINGYGLQEISMTLLFTSIGGISRKSGLTIAILIRTLTILASLPGAAFVPGIMAGQSASNTNETIETEHQPQPSQEVHDG